MLVVAEGNRALDCCRRSGQPPLQLATRWCKLSQNMIARLPAVTILNCAAAAANHFRAGKDSSVFSNYRQQQHAAAAVSEQPFGGFLSGCCKIRKTFNKTHVYHLHRCSGMFGASHNNNGLKKPVSNVQGGASGPHFALLTRLCCTVATAAEIEYC